MNRLFALPGLSVSPLCLALVFAAGAARGDQVFPLSMRPENTAPCRVGCSHFEGYVIVPRHLDKAAPTPAGAEAVMSANRLYLPAADGKTP